MMDCDFSGIREKLIRAKQNIFNLDVEIKRFLEAGKYRVMPYEDKEVLLKGIAYHEKRIIPLRFNVLAGEIIHHLRSCLDHIVWQFSGQWYRDLKPKQIEFPVLEVRPVNKKGLTGYEGHVKGISNPGALILIEVLQPYNSADPSCSLLNIIHKMDITDKHRELVLCGTTTCVNIPTDVFNRFMRYERGEPGSLPVDVGAEFKRNPNIYAQVSFKQFRGGISEPVVQGLTELHNFVTKIVATFDALSGFVDDPAAH